MAREKGDLLQGTLGMLILKALIAQDLHGYGIARWIEQATRGSLAIEEGSLYPALRRLEDRGWVTSSWAFSETNRRVRVYSLTRPAGAHLRAEATLWLEFSRRRDARAAHGARHLPSAPHGPRALAAIPAFLGTERRRRHRRRAPLPSRHAHPGFRRARSVARRRRATPHAGCSAIPTTSRVALRAHDRRRLRQARRADMLHDLAQDVRYGVRQLRNAPRFTTARRPRARARHRRQ